MESMSWSDDTRCLYCEGRLPLYRKITHGQFCSSAHRKAYWQEHERLAVERLHQTHSSLRSYRSLEVHQEAIPYPDLEQMAQVGVATDPGLETELELDPSFEVSRYPIPDISEPPAASELLRVLAPAFLALGSRCWICPNRLCAAVRPASTTWSSPIRPTPWPIARRNTLRKPSLMWSPPATSGVCCRSPRRSNAKAKRRRCCTRFSWSTPRCVARCRLAYSSTDEKTPPRPAGDRDARHGAHRFRPRCRFRP